MAYRLSDISPAFKNDILVLRSFIQGESLYKNTLARALDSLQGEIQFIDVLLDVLLESQRLQMIHIAGIHLNTDFHSYYTSNSLKGWHKQKSPPVEANLISSLADKVYNMRQGQSDFGMLHIGEDVRSVAEAIFSRLIHEKEQFDVMFTDSVFKAHLLNACSEDGVKALADDYINSWAPVTRRMVVVPGLPLEDPPNVSDDKDKSLQKLCKPVHERVMSGKIHYTLTCIPSERDAQFDDIPYEDYLQLFFEMCDQPWDLIDRAQQNLIEKLDIGKTLRFTNNDGTDFSVSIKGMTFANSLIARNVPGSEVFSAPVINSAQGKIIAHGVFSPSGRMKGERIEDIELEFKDGKCIRYTARVGQDILNEMLETDEGSCYLGEVAIGTNPHLKRPVGNISLVEKIGGSFHVALGAAYTATEYMGKPVKFDNGNRSLIHWDITTMLYGKEGCIYLNGEKIMEHGFFVDPALEILNKGWECVPVRDRPDYWKNYDFRNRKY
jgi:aminopeptidase